MRRPVGTWLPIGLLSLLLSLGMSTLGVPSPWLFGGLLAGVALALATDRDHGLPRPVFDVGQGTLGVLIGLLLDPETLAELGGYWGPVLLVVLATLGVSLAAGAVMHRQPGIDTTTGALSMVAGGATGLVAMSRDLGADEQVVGVIQNLRVILIVVTMPLVATTVFGAGDAVVVAGPQTAPWPVGLAVTAACVAVGWPVGRALRLPSAALLGPLAVAAGLSVLGLVPDVAVPRPLADVAFALIGLSIGLGLTRSRIRVVLRALPLAAALIVAVVAACAGLGVLLSALTGLSPLDGYLATTPGGMSAVLATAVGSGAEVTFVLAVQVVRLLLMIASAPVLAAVLRGR